MRRDFFFSRSQGKGRGERNLSFTSTRKKGTFSAGKGGLGLEEREGSKFFFLSSQGVCRVGMGGKDKVEREGAQDTVPPFAWGKGQKKPYRQRAKKERGKGDKSLRKGKGGKNHKTEVEGDNRKGEGYLLAGDGFIKSSR